MIKMIFYFLTTANVRKKNEMDSYANSNYSVIRLLKIRIFAGSFIDMTVL